MHTIAVFVTLASILALDSCNNPPMSVFDTKSNRAGVSYPRAQRTDVVDDYHGTQVADPYRWLEDPDAPATRAWIDAENALTRAFIDAVPERPEIETRLTQLWDYERYGVPFKKGGHYFFTKNDGLQNQAVLMVADSLDGAPRALLDPNVLRADGTIALGETRPSKDGRWLAYALSEAGSDWNTIRVRDVGTAKDSDDVVLWVKFSGIAWAADSNGFYYSTYPDHDTSGKRALSRHRLMFHALGTEQNADTLVYARDDQPEWGFGGQVTEDGTLLVVSQSEGTEQRSRIFVSELTPGAAPRFRPIFDRFDADYEFLGKQGSRLFFRTDNGAPQSRVIAFDLTKTETNGFDVVVPESSESMETALLAGDHLILTYLKDAANEVRVYTLSGGPWDTVALPGIGAIAPFSGEPDDPEAFFAFTSFTTPAEIWRYDVAAKKSAVWRAPKVSFSPSDYVTEQIFCSSKDKTRVPLFVTRKKTTKLSPDTPTFLYGYGGFNVPIKPGFSPMLLAWMERGGSYVVANLRGGAEYGREWHESGTKERKQNVFDDFIASAEFLIARGWTSQPKLAIHGRSNGGLLVGACMTQRPDLFGAAMPGVGVLDMLRYHLFTIGWAWSSDYGRSDDAKAFEYLVKYSPLHNLKVGTRYPPTLITTGDHDDRVVPAHSFKFAAELQHAQSPSGPPVLIRIETRGGHGAGKPTSMQIEEVADQLAFLTRALGASRARAGS